MIRLFLLFAFLLTACQPNDFPPKPESTVIVEFPTPPVSTPTAVPRIKPMFADDRANTTAFFLVMKTNALAGNDQGIAENVLYPLKVNRNGQTSTIHTQADFIKSYRTIFDDSFMSELERVDEDSLFITFDGVRVGDGLFWFNLFCADTACSQGRFLITQINN